MNKLILGSMLTLSLIATGCSSPDVNEDESTQQTTSNVDKMTSTLEVFDGDIKNNALAISPDEQIAIVSNSTIPSIKVYNLNNKTVIGEIDTFITPRNIAFSKDGSKFYVSDSTYGNIREFDSNTLEKLRAFDVHQGVFGFVLNNAGDKIYANNQAEDRVTVINLVSGEIEAIVEGFSGPRQGVVIDDNDNYVYVTNFKGDDVRVLNTETLTIEKTLTGIPSVRAISIDTEKGVLYGASSSDNTINVLDINTGEIIETISVGNEPYGAALSSDNKTVLSGEKASNQISVIDTETLEVQRTITGFSEPRQAIVYSKSNAEHAYVLNADLSISVIDYQEGVILETIK